MKEQMEKRPKNGKDVTKFCNFRSIELPGFINEEKEVHRG